MERESHCAAPGAWTSETHLSAAFPMQGLKVPPRLSNSCTGFSSHEQCQVWHFPTVSLLLQPFLSSIPFSLHFLHWEITNFTYGLGWQSSPTIHTHPRRERHRTDHWVEYRDSYRLSIWMLDRQTDHYLSIKRWALVGGSVSLEMAHHHPAYPTVFMVILLPSAGTTALHHTWKANFQSS